MNHHPFVNKSRKSTLLSSRNMLPELTAPSRVDPLLFVSFVPFVVFFSAFLCGCSSSIPQSAMRNPKSPPGPFPHKVPSPHLLMLQAVIPNFSSEKRPGKAQFFALSSFLLRSLRLALRVLCGELPDAADFHAESNDFVDESRRFSYTELVTTCAVRSRVCTH